MAQDSLDIPDLHEALQLTAARDLMRIYGMDFDVHASHGFERDEQTQDSN